MSVAGGKCLIGHDVGVRVPMTLRYLSGYKEIHALVCQSSNLHIEKGKIDVLPFFAGSSFVERREDGDCGVQSREDIGHGNADLHRLAFRSAGDTHEAAHRLNEQIVTRLVLVGPGLTEA